MTPIDQRDLLPPRRRADQLAGLQILEIVVGDGGDAEHDGGGEQGIGDRAPAPAPRSPPPPNQSASSSEAAEHGEDADARNRAVRRADQAGHIAADRGDDDADDQHEDEGARRSAAPRRPRAAPPAMNSQSRTAIGISETRMTSRRRCRSGCRARSAAAPSPPARAFEAAMRRADAADDRADDLEQGPDRGDADHAGAEEADVVAEDVVATSSARRRPTPGGQDRQQRSHQAVTQPISIAMPTEMPTRWPTPIRAKERLVEMPVAAPPPTWKTVRQLPRPRSRVLASRAKAAAASEPAMMSREALLHSPRRPRASRRRPSAPRPRRRPRDRARSDPTTSARRSGTENITPSMPPIAQSPRPSSNRESPPPADHDQARQHEDDRRQRPRRRGDGLDDIVLEDVRVGEQAQHRHRDHRGRDRGREGEADLAGRDRRWRR